MKKSPVSVILTENRKSGDVNGKLRTVIVRTWDEILLLGAVILLRAALTFYIQWEIRIEKKKKEEREGLAEANNKN